MRAVRSRVQQPAAQRGGRPPSQRDASQLVRMLIPNMWTHQPISSRLARFAVCWIARSFEPVPAAEATRVYDKCQLDEGEVEALRLEALALLTSCGAEETRR